MKDISKLSVIELVALKEQIHVRRNKIQKDKTNLIIRGVLTNEKEFIKLMHEDSEWSTKLSVIDIAIGSRMIDI